MICISVLENEKCVKEAQVLRFTVCVCVFMYSMWLCFGLCVYE